ncbi:MAG: CDP-alcohol phosphatidyltransferase family protein [Candidatus Promineifilaceae bacterium]
MTLYEQPTRREKALAWGVHVYTASGAVFGILAMLAAFEQQWMLSFMWMSVTLFVDAVDGTLARRFRVKEVVPGFDGALLDNMVDYFTYVIVPTIVLYMANMVPEQFIIGTIALISLTSAFQFCQTDAKTEDHYFKGFPSYWNVVIMYLFLLETSQVTNLIVLTICAILVFVPIKYLYPSRTKIFQKLTLFLNMLWAIAFVAAMVLYPNAPQWIIQSSLLFLVYYLGASLYLTISTRSK